MSSRTASTRNPYIYAEDTDEEDLDKITGICGDVFEASPTGGALYGELAKRIRTLLDKEMGVRGWNVVVGRSFGAYLTQRVASVRGAASAGGERRAASIASQSHRGVQSRTGGDAFLGGQPARRRARRGDARIYM